MPDNGWEAGQAQDESFGKLLAFVGNDVPTIALIGLIDLRTSGKGSDLIVFTTADGAESAPGGVKDLAIPARPDAVEVKKGADPATDLFIDTMTPALEGAAANEKGRIDGQVY